MNAMSVQGIPGGVILTRTVDGDGLRPDRVESWNLSAEEWRTIRDFVLLGETL